MNNYSVTIGIYPLDITSSLRFSDEELNDIIDISSLMFYEYNHINKQSSAHQFNKAPVGSVINTNKEFFYFLKTNIELAAGILDFMPFSFEKDSFMFQKNLYREIELFPTQKAYIKWKPVQLDSHILRIPLTLDTILAKYKHKVRRPHDFISLQYGRYYRILSGRKKSWTVKGVFSAVDNQVDLIVNNHSVILSNKASNKREQVSSFMSTDRFIHHKEAHVKAPMPMTETAVVAYLLQHLCMQSEYEHFSDKHKAELHLISEQDEYYRILP